MKRKIITFISSLFLLVPFITPVYAEDVSYWDGSYFPYDTSANYPVGGDITSTPITNSGWRMRTNYKPNSTIILYGQDGNKVLYGMCWYIGEYETVSAGSADVAYFRNQLKVYTDQVTSGSNVYTTGVRNGTDNSFTQMNISVGSSQRIFLWLSNVRPTRTDPNLSYNTGLASCYWATGNMSTSTSNWATHAFKIDLGYETVGTYGILSNGTAGKNMTYQITPTLGVLGEFREGVIDAFKDGNVSQPSGNNGTGTGSAGNTSDGYGNGIPNGSGSYGSTITFDGSDNQVQNQSQYQSQSIESNAVNVTVNNEISGGSGGGSGESDVDRINALDNLLSNQSVGTSFNEAIQNVNNFRQLGVAFADTATVFLGWLPSWVLALLGLMFTLLFFFIILRLLKVFHG